MVAFRDLQQTTLSGNIYLDALTYAYAYVPGYTIRYVLEGQDGDGPYGGATWSQSGARDAFAAAAAAWSEVANINFAEVAGPYNGTGDTRAYDWIETLASLEGEFYGEHHLPHTGTLNGLYDVETGIYTVAGVKAGGQGFNAFVHEIGHGLGLWHPHNEEDSEPNDPSFPGVTGPWELGDYRLNQAVYTVMSYNYALEELGIPSSEDFGWAMGPMAFDIAVVQRIYGANMSARTGNTVYELPTENQSGTGWTTIWDAGGVDTISAGSTMSDAIIDLRAATLDPAVGGAGGYVSRVGGVLGGVTIAHGVVIENAMGGGGADLLIGNAANNVLDGGAGFDIVDYSGIYLTGNLQALVIDLKSGHATGYGNDTLIGIEGAIGGAGNDILIAADGVPIANGTRNLKREGDTRGDSWSPIDLDYHFADRSNDPTFAQEPGMVSAVFSETDVVSGTHFTFTTGNAQRVILDIDNSFNAATEILVFDSRSNLIARANGSATVDAGSASFRDAYLVLNKVPQNERLTVRVDAGKIESQLNGSYDLKVSLQTDKIATGTSFHGSYLNGGDGDDTLFSGSGDDWLVGGLGVDTAVFSGPRSTYTITSPGDYGYQFHVTSQQGGSDFLDSIDWLQFSDGVYAWDTARRDLMLREDDESAPQWTLLTSGGFAGAIGGSGNIFGTAGFDDVTLLGNQVGKITLDASFNRGGDVVRLAGRADEWLVAASGSSAVFGKGGLVYVEVPAGPEGVTIAFDDGVRTLWIDTSQYTLKIGDQPFGYSHISVAAAASKGPAPPAGDNAAGEARLVLKPGVEVTAGGNLSVFGTTESERLHLLFGDSTLDPSFNKGGDRLMLEAPFSTYQAAQVGSSVQLSGGDYSVLIPVGPNGTEIAFAEDVRNLFLDTAIPAIFFGTQQIGPAAVALSEFA